MVSVRRLVSLFLALVMAFSLMVSAGATNTQTAILILMYDGESFFEESVPTGISVKDALDLYADELELEWSLFSSLDAQNSDYIINSICGIGSEPIGADSGLQAEDWSTTLPGYGLEYTESVNGETIYHHIYVGNEWSFTVNGSVLERCTQVGYRFFPEYLPNRYAIQSGDVVVVEYGENIYRWTANSNFMSE